MRTRGIAIALVLFVAACSCQSARAIPVCSLGASYDEEYVSVTGTVRELDEEARWVNLDIVEGECSVHVYWQFSESGKPAWLREGADIRVSGYYYLSHPRHSWEPQVYADSVSPLPNGSSPAGLVVAIVGSVLLLSIVATLSFQRGKILRERKRAARAEAEALFPQVVSVMSSFDSMLERDDYCRNSDYVSWCEHASSNLPSDAVASVLPHLDGEHFAIAQRYIKRLEDAIPEIDQRNAVFVDRRRERDSHVLSSLLPYSLNRAQEDAVLHDEDAVLVVAGAGTGKTACLVAKVAYLVASGAAAPDEILVLTFLKKVREELRKRLDAVSIVALEGVSVHNLHQYANARIGEAEGKKPDVSPHAGNDDSLGEFIQAVLDHLFRSDGASEAVRFLLHDLPSPTYFVAAGSKEEYWTEWRSCNKRSLSGYYVRSREELLIADFLFSMGIDYEYEKPYEPRVFDPEHRQYKPDFFIPSAQLWIEHFGLDEKHQPPPFLDPSEKRRYIQKYRWALKIHKKHGTSLLSTYSYQARDGTLTDVLRVGLEEHGVVFNPMSPQEILSHKMVIPRLSRLSSLLATFLKLYRAGHWTKQRFLDRARELKCEARARRFFTIFEEVLQSYEAHLRDTPCVDYTDMLDKASSYLKEGAIRHGFKYIFVDEFQDIAADDVRLLQALASQTPRPRIFCIGDDWQSIYRFRGGDPGYMSAFGSLLGYHKRLDLTETFRFDARLEKLSSRFVLRNPTQLRKSLVCSRESDSPPVHVLLADQVKGIYPDSEDRVRYAEAVRRALQLIDSRSCSPDRSVYVLARYDRLRKGLRLGRDRRTKFYTIHGSKGLEANYVILVGLDSGPSKYTFPSSFSDDPLLDMLRSEPEQFPHAEERRLFYVALSRAREEVFLIAPRGNESAFLLELSRDGYEVDWIDALETSSWPLCGACSVGVVRLNPGVGELPSWWECSLCGNRPRDVACPRCRIGRIQLLRSRVAPFDKPCSACGYTLTC